MADHSETEIADLRDEVVSKLVELLQTCQRLKDLVQGFNTHEPWRPFLIQGLHDLEKVASDLEKFEENIF